MREFLEATVKGINGIDIPATIQRDACGSGKLGVAGAEASALEFEIACRVEDLNTTVAGIRHVDIPAAVKRDP